MNTTLLTDSQDLAIKLVGCPYEDGGRDPSGFDCWGLVWYFLTSLGISLPYRYDYALRANLKDLMRATSKAIAEDPWERLASPEDLCVVALGRGELVTHVGVWLAEEKLVLHSTSIGVACESLLTIKRSRNLDPKFYKWQQ